MHLNDVICLQKLRVDLLESFERQLQDLIEDFVQEVEKIEQSQCNGTSSFTHS